MRDPVVAPLEERRTQAVLSRRWLDPSQAKDLGALDPEAIARVCADLKQICETQIAFFEPRTKKAPMERYVFMTMVVGDGIVRT